jgi:hypothetical protein
MATTPLLGLELPVTGTLSGTWGDTVNTAITSLLDTAVAGTTTLSTDADVTLTATASVANQARSAILLCTGARTVLRTITAPASSKTYVVNNATTGGFGVKLVGVGPTTGITINNGETAVVAWNGTDFVRISTLGGPITGTTGTFSSAVSGTTGTFSGAVSGTTGTFSGAVSGTTGTFSGAVSGTTGTFSGAVSGTTGTFSGAVSGTTGTFSSNVQMPSANGSCLAGLRNRLINGNFYADQRNAGASQTITAGAALAYTVDRFYAYCTGANVTGQRVAGTAPNAYLYRFTGAASTTKIGFAQRIENLNCQDLAGQTATLSIDLSNSPLTTVTWTAWYASTANTFGTLASPTRTQIATGTFTVTSTLTRYSTNITIPSAATTGIEIELSVGAQTSGTWNIGNVQLEFGATATPFEQRPIGMELALCQRYLPVVEVGNLSGLAFNATTGTVACTFPVTARAAATGITSVGTFNVQYGTGTTASATAAFLESALQSAAVGITSTGMTAATPIRLYNITAGNSRLLFTGCEL